MSESWIWWVAQFGLNILDFVMMYIISHTLMKKYIIVKRQHIILCLIYTFIAGFFFYLLHGFIVRIVNQLILMVMIKFMIKRSELSDLLIIYMLSFIIIGIVQLPIASVIWAVNQSFDFEQSIIFIIIQIFTITVVVPVCKKFKWHQLFYAIHSNIVLKLVFFVCAFLILVIASILNFEYSVSYLFFSTLGILLAGLVLFPIIVQLYRNTIDIISVHDLKNDLLSTAVAMRSVHDPEEIKRMYYELTNELGIDVSTLDTVKTEDAFVHMEAMNKNIKEFIRMKLESHNKKIDIISDITYYESHEILDFKTILKWFGTLLDNAIDASDQYPIYISLYSMDDDFTLKIANEYMGEEEDVKVIFERGYSTKGQGRGIGLYNLYKAVLEQGGKIKTDEYYTEAHNCHYLQIEIQFLADKIVIE